MNKTKTILWAKIKESLISVLPVTGIVILLCFTITPVPSGTLLTFLVGAVLLILGMGFFTLGAEMAMTPMGEHVGATMTKSKKLLLIFGISLFVGIMITVSEPDLQVLAGQVPQIPNMVLIISVAVGVGLFLVFAMVHILFKIKLSHMLIFFYIMVFVLAFFVSDEFLSIAFDSGGVTTGPMTVPFILALGVGVSSIRSDKHAENDSFGLVALSSIGPILAVLILGLIYKPSEGAYTPMSEIDIGTSEELRQIFTQAFPTYLKEVAISLAPIVIFFFIFQLFAGKVSKTRAYKILIGVVYTYIGLVLFLTGVNVGFLPVGYYIGELIGGLDYNFICIPIGMVMGYFIVSAEPAVHVLKDQVEKITSGAIPQKALSQTLSIGVAISVGLAMIRTLTGISIMWFLIPGYAIALILTFFVPKIFTSIAFDSGGVASGAMATTFLLPFAIGIVQSVGGNVITDAFGIVAMVAMTPLIAIQILGLVYKAKLKKQQKEEEQQEQDKILVPETTTESDDDIIDL